MVMTTNKTINYKNMNSNRKIKIMFSTLKITSNAKKRKKKSLPSSRATTAGLRLAEPMNTMIRAMVVPAMTMKGLTTQTIYKKKRNHKRNRRR